MKLDCQNEKHKSRVRPCPSELLHRKKRCRKKTRIKKDAETKTPYEGKRKTINLKKKMDQIPDIGS